MKFWISEILQISFQVLHNYIIAILMHVILHMF